MSRHHRQALTVEPCDERSRLVRKDAALLIYISHLMLHAEVLHHPVNRTDVEMLILSSLVNEDLRFLEWPGEDKMSYSQQMNFRMNMFSFWNYYLGKLAANDFLLGSMGWHFSLHYSSYVWSDAELQGWRALGRNSKNCPKLTVNIRELLDCSDSSDCLNYVQNLIQSHFNNLTAGVYRISEIKVARLTCPRSF